ncbi:MAG: hypothetical protein ACRETW_08535 [Stenotrophobium sp.]
MPKTTLKRDWLEPPEWWKKSKPLRWLAATFVAVALVMLFWTGRQYMIQHSVNPENAVYTQVEAERADLAGFRSYDRLPTVNAALSAAGYIAVLRMDDYPDSPRYPEHRMATLRVDGYRYLGGTGRLVLEFFNNRLYEVDFDPADPARCAIALHRAFPELKRNHIGDAQWISGHLRVASNVDLAHSAVGKALDTDPYVIWQDSRLIAQRDLWDQTYGSIPIKPN